MKDRDPIAELLDYGFGLDERVRSDSAECEILRTLHRSLEDLRVRIVVERRLLEEATRHSDRPPGSLPG